MKILVTLLLTFLSFVMLSVTHITSLLKNCVRIETTRWDVCLLQAVIPKFARIMTIWLMIINTPLFLICLLKFLKNYKTPCLIKHVFLLYLYLDSWHHVMLKLLRPIFSFFSILEHKISDIELDVCS